MASGTTTTADATTPTATNQLNAVPSKEEARTSNSIIKLTTSSSQSHPAPMTAQINYKNGRQQVLINHSAASDVSKEINSQHQRQVKVNSCESNLTLSSSQQQPTDEIVTASSLCFNANSNSFNSSNNNESGMITIVTINNSNNDAANDDDRRVNNNSIV
jgi:hypothetical protein